MSLDVNALKDMLQSRIKELSFACRAVAPYNCSCLNRATRIDEIERILQGIHMLESAGDHAK